MHFNCRSDGKEESVSMLQISKLQISPRVLVEMTVGNVSDTHRNGNLITFIS